MDKLVIEKPSLHLKFCFLNCRRFAEALHIRDNSDPFNIRSSGSKYSDNLKEDARYMLEYMITTLLLLHPIAVAVF